MVSLIPSLLLSGVLLYVFGAIRMITAAIEAPIGYETAEGFQYGLEMSERECDTAGR